MYQIGGKKFLFSYLRGFNDYHDAKAYDLFNINKYFLKNFRVEMKLFRGGAYFVIIISWKSVRVQ